MDGLNPSTAATVSVTFRLTEAAHKLLILECGHCGCNVSAVIREAVVREIARRSGQRKVDTQRQAFEEQHARRIATARYATLVGQLPLIEEENA